MQIRGHVGWLSRSAMATTQAMAHSTMPPIANGTVGGSSAFSGGGPPGSPPGSVGAVDTG